MSGTYFVGSERLRIRFGIINAPRTALYEQHTLRAEFWATRGGSASYSFIFMVYVGML
jgi:hypothetical protein